MKWGSIIKRLKGLDGAKKKVTVIITYSDGHTEEKQNNYAQVLDLIKQGTNATGIIDIETRLADYADDGFYNAFKNDDGIFEAWEMVDDSAMLEGLEETETE